MKTPSNLTQEPSSSAMGPIHSTIKESSIQQYVSQRVFKDKSMLCRIPIPYVLEQQDPEPLPKVQDASKKHKLTKKIPRYDLPYKTIKPFKPATNYEKTPINQYLNYQLSEEITLGLKEVKLLSDQIKYIKEEKRKHLKVGEQKKEKFNKKIRIRKANFKNKQLVQSMSACNLR